MTTLSREEMETCILFNAANRETVYVFSDDPVWQRKLERSGARIVKEHSSGGKEYELEYWQVSIRKKKVKREYTDEQRKTMADRLSLSRKAKER